MGERATRYVVSGLGCRAWATYLPLFGRGARNAGRLVGVVDADAARLDDLARRWHEPVVASTDVDEALAATAPDWLVVTTPDHVHAANIEAALAAGVSVLTEKPMVLDTRQAAAVIEAARTSAAQLLVAHNMRYLNMHVALKRLLLAGSIGSVTQASFAYHVRPGHGRSYFERWHRRSEWSGGLQVTKSCHHFDLLNWWLDDVPAEAFAWTKRNHFLPAGASGLPAPADADIHDTISALIRYRGGATVSYLLSACSSWEGYELRMEGTTGTLSATYEAAPVTGRAPAPTFVAEFAPHDGPVERIELPRQPGNHSGADARMVAAIFRGETSRAENLRQAATALDGGYAVAVGEAVSRSAAAGVPVAIPDLGAVAPLPERHAVVGGRAG